MWYMPHISEMLWGGNVFFVPDIFTSEKEAVLGLLQVGVRFLADSISWNAKVPIATDNLWGESLSHKRFSGKFEVIRAKCSLHPQEIACSYTCVKPYYHFSKSGGADVWQIIIGFVDRYEQLQSLCLSSLSNTFTFAQRSTDQRKLRLQLFST